MFFFVWWKGLEENFSRGASCSPTSKTSTLPAPEFSSVRGAKPSHHRLPAKSALLQAKEKMQERDDEEEWEEEEAER